MTALPTMPAPPSAARELAQFGDLVFNLTWRDVRIRYKQSILGIGWAILLPLSMMLIFTFVFTRAISTRSLADLDMPYALYAYAGLVPWTFFSSGLTAAVNSLVSNRSLLTKVYFPREVFPLSAVASSFVDFCIAMTVLSGLIAYFHWTGTWKYAISPAILMVPVLVILQITLMVGLGMILAMSNLFYRDVRPVFTVSVQLLMFVSAVVVPVPTDGSSLAKLIALNPLVPIIQGYRECILYGRFPEPTGLAIVAVVACCTLVAAWIGFRRASWRFAECV